MRSKLCVTCAVLMLGVVVGQAENKQANGFDLNSDEFPMGVFSVQDEQMMDQLAPSGIKYIFRYQVGDDDSPKGIVEDIQYLDQAHKRGLKVMYGLWFRKWSRRPDGVQRMLKIANAVKDHPGLGFWYLCDEPDNSNTHPDKLKPYYLALKKLTPDIPVAIAHCWSRNWKRYSNVLDIQMVDHYPVRAGKFPHDNVRQFTTFVSQAMKLGKPVVPVAQCYNWAPLKKHQKSPDANLPYRFPNLTEMRFFNYGSFTQGIRGMFWYSMYWMQKTPGADEWRDEVFFKSTKELAEFTKLVGTPKESEQVIRALDDDLLIGVYVREAGTYIVAVNALPIKRVVSRRLAKNIPDGTLTPWGLSSPKQSAVKRDSIRVTLGPWETMIWKLENKNK